MKIQRNLTAVAASLLILIAAINAQNECYNKCYCDGDPHCKNFDCVPFDLRGECTYDFATTKCLGNNENFPSDLSHFTVLQSLAPSSITNRTIVDSLELLLNGNSYNLRYIENSGVVLKVNGELKSDLPYEDQSNGVKVVAIKDGLFLQTSFDLNVVVIKNNSAFSPRASVQLPNAYNNHVCGLCGNFNGKQDDDFVNKNDEKVALAFNKEAIKQDSEWYGWSSEWRDGHDFGVDSDGVSSCQAQLSCGCAGDPHCYDFDKQRFDFQELETKILVGTDSSKVLPFYLSSFQVYQTQVPSQIRNKDATIVDSISLDVLDLGKFTLYRNENSFGLKVDDDVSNNLPFVKEANDQRVLVEKVENGLAINTNFGIQLSLTQGPSDFSPRSNVKLAKSYSHFVNGLCVNNKD